MDKINQFNNKKIDDTVFYKSSKTTRDTSQASSNAQIIEAKNSAIKAASSIIQQRNKVNYDFSDFNDNESKGLKFLD